MAVEELNVVLLVPLSKLVDEVPSFKIPAVIVPSVIDMLAATPLLVSIATVKPDSVLKLDLLDAELSAFVVLPVPPLRVISVLVEPSGLIVLTNIEVIPLLASVDAGKEMLEVPSLPILTSEPLGAFTFAPVLPEVTPTVMSPSVLMFVDKITPLFNDIETLRDASLFILTSAPIGTFTLDSVPSSVFTVL
jgi:hypothetical protein